MPESEEDYDGKITGYPLLDGMLFGTGVPRNRSHVLIRAAELPTTIIEKIVLAFEEAGYQTGVAENNNAMTKEMDLRISVMGPSPIFTNEVLPRISERRIDPQNVPIEFLVGFFFVSTQVKLKEYCLRPHLEKDALRIQTNLPKDTVIEMLSILGVEEYFEIGASIFLDVDMFNKIQPFEEIYNEYKKEMAGFALSMPSREDMLAAKMDELMEKMDSDAAKVEIEKLKGNIQHFLTFCSECNRMTMHQQEMNGNTTNTWCMECK